MKNNKKIKIFNSRIFKNLISIILVLVFIIVTVTVLIIAQGNTVNNGELTRTSIIKLNVIPHDVNAFINGKSVSLNDQQIVNLNPGSVDLKLSKTGYASWEKSVSLSAGLITNVYAQLYPDNISYLKLTTTNISKVFYSKDSVYAFYIVLNSIDPTQNGLWKYKLNLSLLDFNDNRPIQIATFTAKETAIYIQNPYLIKISNDNNKIMFQVPALNIIRIYDINQTNSYMDLLKNISITPTQVDWLNDSNSVLISKDSLIAEVNLSNFETTLISYNIMNTNVYSVNSNTLLWLYNNQIYLYKNKINTLFNIPKAFSAKLGTIQEINSYNSILNVIIVKSINGLFYIDLNKQFIELIDSNGTFYNISSNAKNLIFDKNKILYSYNLTESIDGSSYVSNIGVLNVQDTNIKNSYFSPSGKTILILNKDKTLFTMDNDGGNVKQLIKEFNISDEYTLISADSLELYGVISEKNVNNTVVSNLYKFDLQVK